MARDLPSALASTNDRPLPRSITTPEESRTFLYSHEDRSSAHATRTPIGGSRCPQPRSYDVESTSGRFLRRNRRDIRETTAQRLLLHADDDEPRRDKNPKRSVTTASDSSVDETLRHHNARQQFVMWSRLVPALVESSCSTTTRPVTLNSGTEPIGNIDCVTTMCRTRGLCYCTWTIT